MAAPAEQSRQIEQKGFPKITLERFMQDTLRDPKVDTAVQVLSRTDGYPTREEITQAGLTELSYLALQTEEKAPGLIRSFPGGMASPMAIEILREDIELAQGPIVVLAMIHGAIAPGLPKPGDRFTPEGQYLPQEPCVLLKNYMHQHQLPQGRHPYAAERHREQTCGVGGGNSLNTREQADVNIQALKKWANESGVNVQVIPIEAIVPLGSNIPLYRVYDYSPIESEDNYRQGKDPCQYPLDKLMSREQLNDRLRKLMDNGVIIRGIACSDSRQGTMIPPKIMSKENLSAIGETCKASLAYADCGHTESVAVALGGENATRTAIKLAQTPQAIVRSMNEINYWVSRSAPFIINVPIEFLRENQQAVQTALGNLFSVIDAETHRRGLIGKSPKVFAQDTHENITEIAIPSGLQLIHPDGEIGDILSKIRPGRAIAITNKPRTTESFPDVFGRVHPRTKRAFSQTTPYIIPGTRRPIGPKIKG